MTEIASLPIEPPRRLHFDWVLPALFRPRRTFAKIVEQSGDAWTLPTDFQYWSPDQQNQFMQAQAAASGPVFLYVFPSILSALSVWVGWLVVVGLLHLVFTLLGARGTTRTAMNLVAWAGLPFAVRDLVRIGYMIATRQLVGHPGLSGFASADAGVVSLLLAEFL